MGVEAAHIVKVVGVQEVVAEFQAQPPSVGEGVGDADARHDQQGRSGVLYILGGERWQTVPGTFQLGFGIEKRGTYPRKQVGIGAGFPGKRKKIALRAHVKIGVSSTKGEVVLGIAGVLLVGLHLVVAKFAPQTDVFREAVHTSQRQIRT